MNLKSDPQDPIDAFVLGLRQIDAPPMRDRVDVTSRRTAIRLVPPTMVVAGLLATAFWLRPQPALAAGWHQILENTANTTQRHFREFDRDGKLRSQVWSSGSRYACWYEPAFANRVILEERTDGKRRYVFTESVTLGANVPRPSANERLIGTVRTTKSNEPHTTQPRFSSDFESFVRDFKGEAEPIEDPNGPAYRVTFRHHVRDPKSNALKSIVTRSLIRIDERRRIREKVEEDGTKVVFDYPDVIPASVFVPKPQKRIVPVLDLDMTKKIARQRLIRGAGTKAGVTLRLVLLDRSGDIWVLWTGVPLDGRLSRPARLVGIPTRGKFGPAGLTTSASVKKSREVAPVLGKRIYGHGVRPTVRIGERLTIAIPGQGGTAVFRDVPVLRIATLANVSNEIGLGARGSDVFIRADR